MPVEHFLQTIVDRIMSDRAEFVKRISLRPPEKTRLIHLSAQVLDLHGSYKQLFSPGTAD